MLAALDVDGPVAGFEIVLDDLPAPKSRATKAKPKLDLPEFMPLIRDFAFIVDDTVQASDIVRAAQAAEKALVVDVTVFDIYAGQGVPAGKKIGSRWRAHDPTPREDAHRRPKKIEAIAAKIVADVGRKTGAVFERMTACPI